MPYLFNLHKHAKIWLSKNPALFLNLENADRLIKMRESNPSDEINFIYESSLLNSQAKRNLKEFCELYRITPVDVLRNISSLLQSDLEKELFEFYKNEIIHADKYGNMGMASDILRWLILGSNIDLGSYTDFDVTVNTSDLPENIEADMPLLFNIGSIGDGHSMYTKIGANIDIILVSDSDEAKKQIELFQNILLRSLKHKIFRKVTESALLDFLKPQLLKLNPVEAKKYFLDLTESNQSFLTELGSQFDTIDEFILSIQSDFSTIYPNNLSLTTQKASTILTEIRKLAKYELLLTYVCNVSGPNVLQLWMQQIPLSANILRSSEVIRSLGKTFPGYLQYPPPGFRFDFEAYSFYSQKEINKCFISLNGVPLGSTLDSEEVKRSDQAIEGDCGDLSWLEEGEKSQRKREELLAINWQKTPTLNRIYGFFHGSEPKVKSEDPIHPPLSPRPDYNYSEI